MRAPVQRSQFVGVLEAEPSSSDVLVFSDAVLGAGSVERLQLVGCVPLTEAMVPWEPCLGDEMAIAPYDRAQQAATEVSRFHGDRLQGRRPVVGLGREPISGLSGQVIRLGGEVLVAARGSVLAGSILADVVGRSQLPSCVVAPGFSGTIRKIAVAVDLQEGSTLLMERALSLASQFGAELVPVHAARAESAGDRRPAGGSESKRFDQVMGQVELAFGAAYATRNLLQPLEVVRGDTIEALQAWASGAHVDLLVVGSGGPSRPSLSLGSISAALVASFPVALWVEQLGDRVAS